MQKMEESYQKKEEELRKSLEEQYKEKLKKAKKGQEDSIRQELEKRMISVERLPELLQQFFMEKGIVQAVQPEQAQVPQAQQSSEGNDDDGFDDTSAFEEME